MSTFNSYATKYQHLRMERRSGILQVTLHSNGTTLQMLDNLGYGLSAQSIEWTFTGEAPSQDAG